MRCPDARNLLTQRLREALNPDSELRLERHLAGCGACRAEAEELQRFETLLRSGSSSRAVPAVNVDTAAIFQSERRTSARPLWMAAGLVGVAGATAAVIFTVGREPRQTTGPTVELPVRRGTVARSVQPGPRKAGPKLPGIRPSLVEGSVPKQDQPVGKGAGSGTPELPGLQPRRQVVQAVPKVPSQDIAIPPAPRRKLQTIARVMKGQPGAAPVIRFPRPAPEPEEEPALVPAPRPGAVLAVAFAPASAIPAPTGKVDTVLQSNPRLQTRVTLAEIDRPLGELLPALGKRLQVRLVADRTVADDKATLHFKNRPAAEVLTLLARHMGFRWYTTRGGFELMQDVAAKRREMAMQRNELQPIETQLGLAARLLEGPVAELRPRFDAIEAELKKDQLASQERANLLAEKQTTLDVMLSRATVEAALGVFRSLDPAQIDALLAGAEFRFSSANETLPPALAEKIHDSTSILESIRGPQPRLQADANVRLTDVEDDDTVPPPRRNRQLRLFCTTTSLRGTRQDLHNWGSNWSPKLPEVTTGMAAATARKAADPDLDREVDLVLPGPVKQPPSISGGGLLSAAHLGTVWPRQATVGEIGAAIHQATGLEVVADSFVSARLDPSLLRGKRSVREVLEIVSRELDYTWEKRGRMLLLRNRLFFRDRPAEVPPRLVQGFRDHVQREGAISLDELSGFVAALTDPQVRSMYRYWGWYLEGTGILPPEWLFAYRHHLRFWAGLALPQRQMARSGARLAVAQMSPAQQQLWVAALMSPPESARTPTPEQRNPTMEEMASGSFSLATHEVQAMLFVKTLPDGKRVATGINFEGPPTTDVRKFHHSDDPELEAQPQLSLQGLTFYYHVGENKKLDRKARILIAPLQRTGEPMKR